MTPDAITVRPDPPSTMLASPQLICALSRRTTIESRVARYRPFVRASAPWTTTMSEVMRPPRIMLAGLLRIARAIHLAHAAGAEWREDFIRTNACAVGERHVSGSLPRPRVND